MSPAQVAALIAERDELAERVRQLEAVLDDGEWLPFCFRRLGPVERRLLNVLRRSPSGAGRERIETALYGADPDGRSVKIVPVHVHKLRRKLSPFGIEIESIGSGPNPGIYRFAPGMLDRIEALRIAEVGAC